MTTTSEPQTLPELVKSLEKANRALDKLEGKVMIARQNCDYLRLRIHELTRPAGG